MNVAVQRSAIAVVQVFGLAVWFSMSAVVPSVRSDWGISAAEAVWLTGSVQFGLVVGALVATTLNLADRIPANALLSVSAASAAVWTIALATLVDTMAGAVPFRFLTGVCLAGVYPIGMKLMASWAPSSGRGRALGLLIAALTLGSTLPHLIAGLGSLPWRGVLLAASGVSGLCCLVSPLAFEAGPGLLGMLCVVWGAAVIADSGVFSTFLSEAADPRYVGTALMAQTAIGFALTVVSIQLVPLLAELVGWQYAFVLLAVGPLVGVLAMRGYDTRSAARQASTKEER